jgi:thymidylate kinase
MITLRINPSVPVPLMHLLVQLDLLDNPVVLEGLDCVGKTTTAELLNRDLDRLYLTPSRKKDIPTAYRAYYDLLTLGQYKAFFDLLHQDSTFIMDRCHLSSYVFGGKTWDEVAFCEESVMLVNPRLKGLYLYADDEIVRERMRVKGESQHLFENYLVHKARYESVLQLTTIPFIALNTSLTTL